MSREDEFELVNKIEEVRAQNNRYWMEVVRIAIKWGPRETKEALKKIEEGDRKINALWKQLHDQLPG